MKTTGRNDPCPCGSGKKYKHCCMPGATAQPGVVVAAPAPAAPSVVAPPPAAGADPVAAALNDAQAAHRAGRADEAAAIYQRALALRPDALALHANLGNVLDELGRHDAALASYDKAIALSPSMSELHANRGLTLQALGRMKDAVAAHRRALELKPGSAAAAFNLGLALQVDGDHDGAIEAYRQAVSLAPGSAQAHNNLAVALEARGRLAEAVDAYRRALAIDPSHVAALNGLAMALVKAVPAWHVPMMNDAPRNEAYYKALRKAVTPDTTVFEIGTGSGLLSMMAATAGARHVTTCEAEPLIAATAQRIIDANGLGARITLLAKKSNDVAVGAGMDERADILVSEIFSSELLGERVLPSIEDARRRLLKPGCRIIPASGSIMIALFGGDEIADNLTVREACGFRLDGFNAIVPRKQFITRNDLAIEMLSAGVPGFTFNFEQPGDLLAQPETRTLRLPVTAAGRCLGIIQWMHLQMDAETSFENHPAERNASSGWTRCAYLLDAPVDLKPGQVAVVTAAHNRTFPWFSVTAIE